MDPSIEEAAEAFRLDADIQALRVVVRSLLQELSVSANGRVLVEAVRVRSLQTMIRATEGLEQEEEDGDVDRMVLGQSLMSSVERLLDI